MPTKVPKCDLIQSPRAPSPCSTIVSIAWRAEARSVTAISSGHSKMSVTAWARAGPMNTASSPYRAHRAARAASIPRDRWATGCHGSAPAGGQRLGVPGGREPGRVVQRHPLGPLQVDEVAQRPLAERHQRDLHARRVPAGQDREVGPLEMRRRADGGQDVGGQRQVQHLLLDHGNQRLFPGLHPGELAVGQALIRPALERELRVQVLTHQAVLDLAGLTQEVHQLPPGIHPQRRLSRRIARDVSGHGYHLTYGRAVATGPTVAPDRMSRRHANRVIPGYVVLPDALGARAKPRNERNHRYEYLPACGGAIG